MGTHTRALMDDWNEPRNEHTKKKTPTSFSHPHGTHHIFTILSTLLSMGYYVTLMQQMRPTKKNIHSRLFPKNFVIKINKFCKIRNCTFGIVIFHRKCLLIDFVSCRNEQKKTNQIAIATVLSPLVLLKRERDRTSEGVKHAPMEIVQITN